MLTCIWATPSHAEEHIPASLLVLRIQTSPHHPGRQCGMKLTHRNPSYVASLVCISESFSHFTHTQPSVATIGGRLKWGDASTYAHIL